MNLFINKSECCGCTSCMNICTKNAISMIADKEGFLYPKIDYKLCIDCKMCIKVCPLKKNGINNEFDSDYKEEREVNPNEQFYYAAKHKDIDVIESSSSGGVFTALSDYILENKGSIYGAAFDENFVVKHMKAIDKSGRDKFKGSKYVQSSLNNIFSEIRNDLNNDMYVMFTGTPCQCSGLKNYIIKSKTEHKKLYMCDFICHGTPSPLIWKEYIEYLQEKFDDKIVKFSFRSKRNGWKNAQIEAVFLKGEYNKECNSKYSFLKLFRSLVVVRKSCFNCKFTSYNRNSDITIGDLWNIESVNPGFDNDKGVSSVIINSKNGVDWFNKVKYNLDYIQCSREECWQPHLEYSSVEPKIRSRFWSEYNEKGIGYIVSKYGKGTLVSNAIRILTPIIRKLGLYVLAGKVYKILFRKK